MWETRVETGETWIILLFSLQFVLLSQLYFRYRNEASTFISLFDFFAYLRIFGKERELSVWRPFQIGLSVFLLSVIALIFTFWWSYFHATPHDPIVFLKAFGVLFSLNCIRYFSILLFAWLFELQALARLLVFKSISSYGYLSLLIYSMSLLYYFSPYDRPEFMIWGIMGVLGLGNLLIQINAYLGLKGISLRTSVYLFFYICTFKIAPWFWIYQCIEQLL